MSLRLTTPQKSVLVRAYRNSGTAVNVTPVRGEALERRGYGTYHAKERMFINNYAGNAYGREGRQLEEV